MKIFSEQKNKYFLATVQIIERVFNGDIIPVKDLDTEIMALATNSDTTVGFQYLEKLKKYGIFDLSDKNQVKLAINAPVPVQVSIIEKLWLKDVLADEKSSLFLNNDEKALLLERLRDVNGPLASAYIITRGYSGSMDEITDDYIAKFQTVLWAINMNLSIEYSNRANNGIIYKNRQAIPYKLEYSILQRKFRVSMWNIEEQRPIKTNLETMFNISLGSEVPVAERKTILDLVEERRATQPIKLRIINRNNTVERASMLFSQYDRTARWLDQDNLSMEINYYVFDENELISNILSLGPNVVVTAPERVRSKIVQILDKGLQSINH